MKKTIFASAILLLIVLTSCDEKKLLGDVTGAWKVNKYVVNNQDKTAEFNAQKPNFGWVFREDKTYSQFWNFTYTEIVTVLDTVYVADTANAPIDRVDTSWVDVPRIGQRGVSGTWVLINSNKYLQTRDDSLYNASAYKIVSHKSSSLHLFKGNEDWYLEQDR